VWKDIILCYGCIGSIVTDNGPEFKGALSELLKKHDIPQVQISPYNSQVNRVVEQGHFAIKEALVKACEVSIHCGQISLEQLSLQTILLSDGQQDIQDISYFMELILYYLLTYGNQLSWLKDSKITFSRKSYISPTH
jgi:hypothetical protein